MKGDTHILPVAAAVLVDLESYAALKGLFHGASRVSKGPLKCVRQLGRPSGT
jgi:hypothetical protein